MALREVGLRFVADDVVAFIRDTERARDAEIRFVRAIADGGPAVSRSSQVMTGALRQVGVIATNAFVDAGLAILKFSGDGIRAAGDFEAGMLRFGAVTGGALRDSGQSLQQFESLFIEMGAKTQFSAAQAQEAAINLAKGGITPAAIAGEALAETLNLAAAGELDLAQAAEITAKQLGVWAETGVTASNVADLLSQAANASTVGVSDLALGLAQAGGVAKVAGLSFEETVQTMALLAPGFGSASDAGTSFKAFLSNLIPTTKPAIKAMTDLGLYTTETGSAFYDAQGNFIGMESASRILADATQGLTQEQRSLALETIFGSDAIRSAAIIANAGTEGYAKMGESMNAAGSAADQAAARNQGLNFALETLKGSLDTLSIVAGNVVIPVITEFINTALIPMVNTVTEVTQGVGSMSSILAEVKPVFFGITAAAGAYALTLSGTLIPALIAQAAAAAAAATALAAALAPYAAIAIAVYEVTKAFDEFNAKVEGATQKLLESRRWWSESTEALKIYADQSKEVKSALSGEVQELENLRAKQEAALESLGRRMAAGIVSEAQYNKEMAAINADADAIAQHTEALKTDILAQQHAGEWVNDGLMGIEDMTNATHGLTQAVGISTDQMAAFVDQIKQIRDEGARTLGTLLSNSTGFMGRLEGLERSHQQRVADIIRGGGGGGGGSRVSASEQANKRIEELNKTTNDRLVEQEQQTQQRLITLEQQTQDKLVAIDQRAREQREAELIALRATIETTYADLVAMQEANDLDLVGADEKRMAALAAREQAEATARASNLAAMAEAQQMAANGDAALAQEILKIRQDSIAAQQRLDEEYARRQAELAGNPEALAALKQQYDEATAAIKTAEETKVALATSAAQQHAAAAETEKRDVLAQAEQQKSELITKAEEQKNDILAKAEEQKNQILQKAQEQAASAGGIQGQSIADRLAAEESAYQEELQKQAVAYATEQAAQLQHLGQLLINYVNSQVEMGKVSAEKGAELTAALRAEYGVQQSLSETLFDEMLKNIDEWAASTGTPIETFVQNMQGVSAAGIDAQTTMDTLTNKYTEELIAKFRDGAIPTVEELIRQLAAIPARVATEVSVHTNYTASGEPPQQVQRQGEPPQARAEGGPVAQGSPYIVGERGRELFIPSTSGVIVPTHELHAMSESARLSALATVHEKTVQMRADTLQRLRVLEQEMNADIIAISKEAREKIAKLDEKMLEQRRAAMQDLTNTIRTGYADLVAMQEANDLDLVGFGGQSTSLKAREQSEAAYRAAMQAAYKEARDLAASGEAALAQDILKIREGSISAQQRLDEEYAKRQRELANNPEALAALKEQYDEATAAIKMAADIRIEIARAAAEEIRKEAENERDQIISDAEQEAAKIREAAEAAAAYHEKLWGGKGGGGGTKSSPQPSQPVSPPATPQQQMTQYYNSVTTHGPQYTLNVNTTQPSQGVMRDFALMRTLAF